MAKKTTKPAAKKSPAKKPATKKPVAKKPTTVMKPATKVTKLTLPATRRPDPNLPPDVDSINTITDDILYLINYLDDYAANLRALDRKRHNGVGLRRQGFIEAALRLSTKFPQYFPHWLSTAKFNADLNLFNAIRSLVEVCRSLEEKAWNINIEASDMVFTDALEYYSQVQDAAERRIDSAESIYNELFEFFRHSPLETEDKPATQKQAKRDADALIKGKKEGKMILENRKPKLTGGKREIIDETYKDSASFKETEQGSINE